MDYSPTNSSCLPHRILYGCLPYLQVDQYVADANAACPRWAVTLCRRITMCPPPTYRYQFVLPFVCSYRGYSGYYRNAFNNPAFYRTRTFCQLTLRLLHGSPCSAFYLGPRRCLHAPRLPAALTRYCPICLGSRSSTCLAHTCGLLYPLTARTPHAPDVCGPLSRCDFSNALTTFLTFPTYLPHC